MDTKTLKQGPKLYLVIGGLFLVQILFSINYSTSKIVVTSLNPLLWSNIRFWMAGIILLLITLILKRNPPQFDKKFWLGVIPLSLLGLSFGQGLFLFGLRFTTSVNTAVLTSSIPLLTMVVVLLRKQDKITSYKIAGLLLGFVGVLSMRDLSSLSFSSETFIGDLLVLLGGLCFALYLSYGKKFVSQYDNLWVTTIMFLVSALFMTLVNISQWQDFHFPTALGSSFYLSASYTILGATVVTYLLNNWVLKYSTPNLVSLFIYLQPVCAAFIGWYFLNETVTWKVFLSTGLIMGGVLLSLKKVTLKNDSQNNGEVLK